MGFFQQQSNVYKYVSDFRSFLVLRIKFRTKCIFQIFYIWKFSRISHFVTYLWNNLIFL